MPIAQDREIPKINIVFTGFVLSRIKEGSDVAEVGALNDGDACHRPKISVFRNTPDGRPPRLQNISFDIDQNIELKVENTGQTKIKEYRKPGFTRDSETNDENDFGWVLNLNDLFGGQFPLAVGLLKPVFRINNAEFYTDLPTKHPMRIKFPDLEPQPFGRIAENFAANVYFDTPDSRAVLRNGNNELLTIKNNEQGITYTIVFGCHCQQELAISDFPGVYKLLPGVPKEKRVDFVGATPDGFLIEGAAGGEVPCMAGNLP